MTTATKSPPVRASAALGIWLAEGFSEVEVCDVVERAGYSTAFLESEPAEAIARCQAAEPDVVLLGAERPSRVLGLVGEVLDVGREIKLVLICKRSGGGEVRKALDAGVSGVVSLADLESALPQVIEVVRAGQLSVPGARGGELQKKVLTAREKQILGLVVMGLSNAEIASKLFLAESTVKSHLSSAFAKLGVASRSEAASLILDPRSSAGLGILTIPTR